MMEAFLGVAVELRSAGKQQPIIQPKTSIQSSLFPITAWLRLAACALFSLALAVPAQAEDAKPNPTGTWTWTVAGRQGGPDRKMTLKLKLDGDKLTGTLTSPGRQGGPATDTAIEEAKFKAEEVSFNIVREFNGNKFVQKYAGKLSGDVIKGKVEFDRNGEAQSRDWEAKREVEKK